MSKYTFIKVNDEIGDNVFDIHNCHKFGDIFEKNGRVTNQEFLKFEEGLDANLQYMTADQYLRKCVNLFGDTVEGFIKGMDYPERVDIYAENMKKGNIFPAPYIDFANKTQEGRHRALAFKKVFGEDAKMPVIVAFKTRTGGVSDEEILEYIKKAHDSDEQWKINFWFNYIKYNRLKYPKPNQ